MAAEKKSVGHAYNVDFLNVVFAASSIVLFVCTVWMVWDDFDREWKNTQRQFTQLELEVTRQQLAQNVARYRHPFCGVVHTQNLRRKHHRSPLYQPPECHRQET